MTGAEPEQASNKDLGFGFWGGGRSPPPRTICRGRRGWSILGGMDTGAPRILVVDDDAGIRDALQEMLRAEGMDVIGQASDGEAAVEAARQHDPDVVLMDLRMPRMSGTDAAARIRAMHPTMQVVILSAYDDPGLDRSATEAGAYAYLVKGCSASLVCDVVREAVKLKRGLDERG